MITAFKQLFAEVFGFACFQGFLFALFYRGSEGPLLLGFFDLDRGSLLLTLLFAALMLGLLRGLSATALQKLMKPEFMYGYALLLIASSFSLLAAGSSYSAAIIISSAVQGVAISPLLCAWGRLLGSLSLDDAAFIVIAGSVAGALISAFSCLAPAFMGYLVIDLLPLGAASTLHLRMTETASVLDRQLQDDRAASAKAIDLSARIMLGTFVFGVGSGFAQSFMGSSAGADVSFPASLCVFIMLGIAALQIFFHPVALHSENASSPTIPAQFAAREGAIAYVYRLAILLMVAGFLFAPALQDLTFNGQSLVFAGFLGLIMVLVIVFLINAFTVSRDPALAFSAGFAFLLGGQTLGLLLGNLCDEFTDVGVFEPWAFALAGLCILLAFLFLFTENDLGELGSVAAALDSFDEACECLAQRCGLSKREAEILPLALKGRTGERIADQFVISKSTVDTHLRRIYSKCGVHSRQELIDLGERVAEEIARQHREGK